MLKKELRIKYLAKRHEMSEFEINLKSRSVLDLLSANFNLSDKIVSLFLPIKYKNELNTYLILESALNQKSIVGIPKTKFKTSEMIHFEFEDVSQIVLNEYNIPEPIFGNIISEEKFDFVFVPLLTIDKNGNRVGYGKGFYDRFLSKCKKECLFIGLYLFDVIEEIDDLNEFDLPLHFCVTPNQIIKF